MNDLNSRLNALSTSPVVLAKEGVIKYQDEITEAINLENQFHSSVDKATDALAKTVLNGLSFQYRIESIKKTDAEKSPSVENDLKQALIDWKKTISQYTLKEVTASNLKTIKELAKYDRFVAVLLKNKKATDEFFQLIFRNQFPVKLAVQYFKICGVDLQDCLLDKQVSVFHLHDRKILQITKRKIDGALHKDLEFFINKKFASILNDENKIETNNGTRTWREIKEIWSKSKRLPAEMAIFEDEGMIFFKPQGLKRIDDGQEIAVDTKKDNFWDPSNLPKFLTVSKEKLEELLDTQIPDKTPHVATIQGSYVDSDYVEDAHGASFIYLRQENGSYLFMPFSKYAKGFPQTKQEKKKFIGNSVEGEFTYPDLTPFYKHRTHAISFEFLDSEQVAKLLKNYGQRVWNFQFAGNNCSKEWQSAFKEVLGINKNYFNMPLLEAKFPKPLNYIFGPISWINKYISSIAAFWLVHLVHVLLGSKRAFFRDNPEGMKESACVYNELRTEQNLFVPGQLGKRIKERKIRGTIYFGGDKQFSHTSLV